MFFNTLTTYDGQMKRRKIPLVATFKTCFDDHFDMIKIADPIMATPKLPHQHWMEMHTILLHPWNTNSETNRSMKKKIKIGKMQ
jgi:hypothetical protein